MPGNLDSQRNEKTSSRSNSLDPGLLWMGHTRIDKDRVEGTGHAGPVGAFKANPWHRREVRSRAAGQRVVDFDGDDRTIATDTF
jgi:hypothetical protein